MRNALALVIAGAINATVVPAQAHERWPVVPAEIGVAPRVDGVGWAPYRCAVGPVYNFYHGAYYGGEPPAVYLGYAYRPYYRYTAYLSRAAADLCLRHGSALVGRPSSDAGIGRSQD